MGEMGWALSGRRDMGHLLPRRAQGSSPALPWIPAAPHFQVPYPTPWVRGRTPSDSARQSHAGAARSGSPHLRAPLTSCGSGSRGTAGM